MTVALLFAVNRFVVPADHDVRAGEVYAAARSRTSATARGSSRAAPPASSASAPSAGRRSGGSQGLGMRVLAYDPYNPDATHTVARRDAAASATSCRCTRSSRRRPQDLMGAEQFALMKEGSIYVNSARALLHDVDALTAALQSGHLARRGPRPLQGREPRARPSAVRDEQRRAHAAHRRRDVRHRSEPLEADRRRRRPAPPRRATRPLREPRGAADEYPEGHAPTRSRPICSGSRRRACARTSCTAPPATSRRDSPTATSCSRRRRSPTRR